MIRPAATLSWADAAVKDALYFFLSSCLDVGRGHHPVQGTGGTVRKWDLWLRTAQQDTGNAGVFKRFSIQIMWTNYKEINETIEECA